MFAHVAGAIGPGLLGKLVAVRESDDVPAPQLLGRPRELLGVHDVRRLGDAGQRPRDAAAAPDFMMDVDRTAIHLQEGGDLLQRALEGGVDRTGGDVNQAGGELRQERLEPQALLHRSFSDRRSARGRGLRAFNATSPARFDSALPQTPRHSLLPHSTLRAPTGAVWSKVLT